MRVERTFPADPQSVPAARRFATGVLRDSPADARESIELMVSELTTNGIRHGQTSFRLVIEQTPDQIRVEVTDGGSGRPQMRFPAPDEPTGRGLQIVDMLSEEWGVDRDGASGKTVWFTVSVAAQEGEAGDEAREGAEPTGGRTRSSRDPTSWTFLVRLSAAAARS